VVGARDGQHNVGEALAEAIETLHEPRGDVARVVVGGADTQLAVPLIAASFPYAAVTAMNDVDLMASAVAAPLVAVVGGTGSIVVRRASAGDSSRRGGWGWFLGDEGSGSWIGREALRTVLSGLENGVETALTSSVADWSGARKHGPEDLSLAIYRKVYGASSPPLVVSALAPAVVDAANSGDAAAEAICQRAAGHLCGLAASAVQPGDSIVFGGSVARALESNLRVLTAERCPSIGGLYFFADGVPGALAAAAEDPAFGTAVAGAWDLWRDSRLGRVGHAPPPPL
jgi:glucosamine kinase